jgi:hypothetical protein
MEMVIPNWALGILGVLALAIVAGWVLVAFNIAVSEPPQNRPAPPGLIEQNEEQRIEALRKVAARLQEQREASARISRGF